MMVQRKQVIVVSLVLMLMIAGYLQYSYKNSAGNLAQEPVTQDKKFGEPTFVDNTTQTFATGEKNAAGEITGAKDNDYFALAKFDREKKNDESIEKLQKIIEDSKTSKEVKDDANKQIMALVNNSKKELVIEQLVKAKGFDNAVVLINDKNVDVIVKVPGNITADQAAKIADIVTREAGVSIKDVHIIPKN